MVSPLERAHVGVPPPRRAQLGGATDGQEAAEDLLGSDCGTLNTRSSDQDGLVWLHLWRDAGTRDAATLERAGLAEAALRLLDYAAGLPTTACRHDHRCRRARRISRSTRT